jgi:hypothetical protein
VVNQIEAMKLALEALEYPGPSWPEGREKAAQALRTAIEDAERYEDENFKPDWMNYQEGFAAGVLEGREQMKQSAERVEPVAWPTVDELAQHIRWINGSNKMGAGSHAESILEWLQAKTIRTTPPAAPVHKLQCFHCQDTIETLNDKVMHLMAQRAVAEPHKWVGLNGDEVNECAAGCHLGNSVQGAIRKAESLLSEKNKNLINDKEREFVYLTLEEINSLWDWVHYSHNEAPQTPVKFASAIEQRLKEKNHHG